MVFLSARYGSGNALATRQEQYGDGPSWWLRDQLMGLWLSYCFMVMLQTDPMDCEQLYPAAGHGCKFELWTDAYDQAAPE